MKFGITDNPIRKKYPIKVNAIISINMMTGMTINDNISLIYVIENELFKGNYN